jgi:CO/xanthine dehydrogenase FAD-binding subunit
MRDFEYVAAQAIDEVTSLLQGEMKSYILSGGTDLLVQLREGRKQADLVIDIKRIPEVNALESHPQAGLAIGSAVPCWRIRTHAAIQADYPGLCDAIALIGGMQVQGRASVGGNLCNSSPAADTIPALIVHHAVCVIAAPGETRELPVEDFCIAPGKTALLPGEFLLALHIPQPPAGFGAAYQRFIPRNEMDIAVVGAGVSVQLDETCQRFVTARIALGAVAPTPLLVPEAGDFLAGKEISEENITAAARIAQAAARPITDLRGTAEQRRHLVSVLTRRALAQAIQRASHRSLSLENEVQ